MPKDERPSLRDLYQSLMRSMAARDMVRAGLEQAKPTVDRTPRCPFCEYELSGLETTGPCPECGRRYTRESVEEAIRSRARWEATHPWRMIALLLVIDTVASIPASTKNRILGPREFEIVLLLIKVLIMDGLIIVMLGVLMVLMKGPRRTRARVAMRWAFWGGVVSAGATFAGGFFPNDFFYYPPFMWFAIGLGLSAVFGWFASITHELVHDR